MVYNGIYDACPRERREQKGRTVKNGRSGLISPGKEGELRRGKGEKREKKMLKMTKQSHYVIENKEK
jgi:hypothetical protein